MRHHRKECLKVQIFANFCGLTEDPKSTLEHLNFFLFCMQCMNDGFGAAEVSAQSEEERKANMYEATWWKLIARGDQVRERQVRQLLAIL